jgi:hypothetical protein
LGGERGLAAETEKTPSRDKSSNNAARTPSRLHAVLGALTEYQARKLEQAITANLTRLLHMAYTFATDKKHNLPKADKAMLSMNQKFGKSNCHFVSCLRDTIVSNTFLGVTPDCNSIPNLPAILGKLILTFAI